MKQTETEPKTDGVAEHLPSCGQRCTAGCAASPRRAALPQGPAIRVLHTEPVKPRPPAPPLWEYVADLACVETLRAWGVEPPSPHGYTRYERANERYSLDRWTRPDGLADQALEAVRAEVASHRKSRARAAPDVEQVAALIRSAFPGLAAPSTPSPAVKKRRPARPQNARSRELYQLAVGDGSSASNTASAPPFRYAPMFEASEHIRQVFTAHAWALALILFGREKDSLSDYAFGRLFKGAPIREARAPFASPAHVLSVASRPLPGLGGGTCAWPSEDPRMRLRTWSKIDEMLVKATHAGTDHVRGERAVNRAVDAGNVVRRAGLTAHDRAAVQVLCDRDLTRDDKAARLREIEALRRGVELPRQADDERDTRVRAATADVSDANLLRQAKAAQQRLAQAVARESRAGDALAPKREEKSRRARAVATAGYADA